MIALPVSSMVTMHGSWPRSKRYCSSGSLRWRKRSTEAALAILVMATATSQPNSPLSNDRPSLSFLIGKLFKFYCRSYGRNYFGDVRLCIPSMHSVYVRLAARCPKWCRVLVSMLEGGLVCCGSRGQEHRISDSIGEKCLWRIGLVGCVDIISACMQ